MANTSSTTKPAMLRTRPIPWVMLLANSSSCMAERVGRISMLDPIFRCWDGRRNRQMGMGSINGFYERWLNSPLRHYSAVQLFYYFSCQDLSLTEKTVFENPEVAKYVLQRFLNINDQMDESILSV